MTSAGPRSDPSLTTDPDAKASSSAKGIGRLVGVDLARALAVFGMYAVHVGPPSPAVSGVGGWLIGFSEGRASALFALLAGFSIVIIAGRREPKVGQALRQAKARIVLRAAVLLAVGTTMTMVVGDVVILNYYAVYFLLTLPLLRLRAQTLIILATVLAVVTPLLQLGLTSLITPEIQQAIDRVDPLERLSGVGILDLLVTGFYPAVTWITFVVAGMALARLDLARTVVRVRAAVTGAALTLVGYGVPWMLAQILGGEFKALHDAPSGRAAEAAKGAFDKISAVGDKMSPVGDMGNAAPGDQWMSLLLAQPHSASTFDLIGCIGIAVLVVVGCLALMDGVPLLRRLLAPVIAVGTMSLTVYVGHFMIPQALGIPLGSETSVIPLLVFIATATVFAFVWSRFAKRGPLEQLLHLATLPAKRIR